MRRSGFERYKRQATQPRPVILEEIHAPAPILQHLSRPLPVNLHQGSFRKLSKILALQNRRQMLEPDGFPSAFHSPFVVPFARTGKTGLENVVAGHGEKTVRQFPLIPQAH